MWWSLPIHSLYNVVVLSSNAYPFLLTEEVMVSFDGDAYQLSLSWICSCGFSWRWYLPTFPWLNYVLTPTACMYGKVIVDPY